MTESVQEPGFRLGAFAWIVGVLFALVIGFVIGSTGGSSRAVTAGSMLGGFMAGLICPLLGALLIWLPSRSNAGARGAFLALSLIMLLSQCTLFVSRAIDRAAFAEFEPVQAAWRKSLSEALLDPNLRLADVPDRNKKINTVLDQVDGTDGLASRDDIIRVLQQRLRQSAFQELHYMATLNEFVGESVLTMTPGITRDELERRVELTRQFIKSQHSYTAFLKTNYEGLKREVQAVSGHDETKTEFLNSADAAFSKQNPFVNELCGARAAFGEAAVRVLQFIIERHEHLSVDSESKLIFQAQEDVDAYNRLHVEVLEALDRVNALEQQGSQSSTPGSQ